MARFDDYHRTVVGYHGTGLSTALRLVNRIREFAWSEKDYDWLGRGIYFWEYAPRQALNFAKIRQRQYQKKKNVAVHGFGGRRWPFRSLKRGGWVPLLLRGPSGRRPSGT